MAQGDVIQKDLGLVTAYGYALAGGYTGTEEQFKTDFARLMNGEIQQVETFDATSCWTPDESVAEHLRSYKVYGTRLGRITYVEFNITTDGAMSYSDSYFGTILHASDYTFDNLNDDLVKKVTFYRISSVSNPYASPCTMYSETDRSWPINGNLVIVRNEFGPVWRHTEDGRGQQEMNFYNMPYPKFDMVQLDDLDCNAPTYINYTVCMLNNYTE